MKEPHPLQYAEPQPRPKSRAWELFSDYAGLWCLALLALFFCAFGLLASYYHGVLYR